MVAIALQRLTAAGTAPDLHRIPFSDAPPNVKEHQPDGTNVGKKLVQGQFNDLRPPNFISTEFRYETLNKVL